MIDRAGDGGAELVAAQFGLVDFEVAGGVEHVVAEELVERAAEAVGAALGDDAQHAAGVAAVLGGEAGGDHLEFLHAFERAG